MARRLAFELCGRHNSHLTFAIATDRGSSGHQTIIEFSMRNLIFACLHLTHHFYYFRWEFPRRPGQSTVYRSRARTIHLPVRIEFIRLFAPQHTHMPGSVTPQTCRLIDCVMEKKRKNTQPPIYRLLTNTE